MPIVLDSASNPVKGLCPLLLKANTAKMVIRSMEYLSRLPWVISEPTLLQGWKSREANVVTGKPLAILFSHTARAQLDHVEEGLLGTFGRTTNSLTHVPYILFHPSSHPSKLVLTYSQRGDCQCCHVSTCQRSSSPALMLQCNT
jgi:hypothetical protein